MAEVVNTDENHKVTPLGHTGRSRNTFANSLRKPKVADSGMLFRSLRAPRTEPSTKTLSESSDLTVPVRETTDIACLPLENAGALALIPLQTSSPSGQQGPESQHELQLSIPVPAPRFHTLKRHAYQNIPLPIKKTAGTDQQIIDPQQFLEVKFAS